LVHYRNGHLTSSRDTFEQTHITQRTGPNIARAREPDLAGRGNGRAPKTDCNGIAVRPIGDFAGLDYGAGTGLAPHCNRSLEVDFLPPGEHLARNRKGSENGLSRGRRKKLGLKCNRAEMESNFAHGFSWLIIAAAIGPAGR